MPELRSLVASAIQQEPDVYSKVVLEQDPDDYCRWIKTDDAWGGAIEMGILAKHFEVEICSIDVQVCLSFELSKDDDLITTVPPCRHLHSTTSLTTSKDSLHSHLLRYSLRHHCPDPLL